MWLSTEWYVVLNHDMNIYVIERLGDANLCNKTIYTDIVSNNVKENFQHKVRILKHFVCNIQLYWSTNKIKLFFCALDKRYTFILILGSDNTN